MSNSFEVIDQRATVAPDIDPDTRWWWDALGRGELLIPHCQSCDRTFFPPTPTCSQCGSESVDDRPLPEQGKVESWIVVHRTADETFASETPYTIAAVLFDGGGRIFGRIANGPLEDNMVVRPVAYIVDETTLLGFERVTP
ncbi:hypothetical protein CJ179_35295 [Rhodococcus sp. ACS1]|uniref:Zn-ribbon domain-containing OB-fold protein n=1 Tax=unclassified Rhodococcus (in: high G+C Gram-positive bacteria) TaxID=192944 RepID=UPI000769F3B2|nr:MULTISPECIES: zinc ribbon domain-containing protein [unclassified Rhodococcus (in: high G+C Gram-positive bacteria)]KXF53874.1 hypothetical protein AXA44_07575 [Rhodococcus sp. SC4]KXX57418.1 hypothetical protein AZG88_11455 [Rhodococcus sp. LB1]PBC39317.1 hypothetical protein CJ179_35295 [Rhodococcus sp. ACS1]PBC57948.1 hypothetical protein CJ177_08910 [Rhodococcus sp. ACPA1]